MLLKITAVIESKKFLGFLLPFCCTGLLQCHCPGGRRRQRLHRCHKATLLRGLCCSKSPQWHKHVLKVRNCQPIIHSNPKQPPFCGSTVFRSRETCSIRSQPREVIKHGPAPLAAASAPRVPCPVVRPAAPRGLAEPPPGPCRAGVVLSPGKQCVASQIPSDR